VRFVTATDLPRLYPDTVHTEGATETDLLALARRLAAKGVTGVDFQVIENRVYSVADQFELLTVAVNELLDGKPLGFPLPTKGLLGPDNSPSPSTPSTHLAWPSFRDATKDVLDFIRTEQRVPARVFVGPDPVAPAGFLVALARVYEHRRQNGRFPIEEGVDIGTNIEILPAQHVAKDTPELFGGWVIHKEGFRAPKIQDVARLQAWSLKPAVSRQRDD